MDDLRQKAESRKYSSAHVVHLVHLDDGQWAAFDVTRQHFLGTFDANWPAGEILALLHRRTIPSKRTPTSRAERTAALLASFDLDL